MSDPWPTGCRHPRVVAINQTQHNNVMGRCQDQDKGWTHLKATQELPLRSLNTGHTHILEGQF